MTSIFKYTADLIGFEPVGGGNVGGRTNPKSLHAISRRTRLLWVQHTGVLLAVVGAAALLWYGLTTINQNPMGGHYTFHGTDTQLSVVSTYPRGDGLNGWLSIGGAGSIIVALLLGSTPWSRKLFNKYFQMFMIITALPFFAGLMIMFSVTMNTLDLNQYERVDTWGQRVLHVDNLSGYSVVDPATTQTVEVKNTVGNTVRFKISVTESKNTVRTVYTKLATSQ